MSLLTLDHAGLTIDDHRILDGVSLSVAQGEVLGLVGESGSGKSLTALSILNLLPRGARLSGRIDFDGTALSALSEREMTRRRGAEIGMIFQEPMTALNPLMTIGDQVAETIRIHKGWGRGRALRSAGDILAQVGLPSEKVSPSRYPHELSGGQRQRVGIAMAVALGPKLLIADEPTTALDVTTQAQILALLAELTKTLDMALLLITHDLGIVSSMADRVAVLHAGRVVETGPTGAVLAAPRQAYTRQLLAATLHRPQRIARAGSDVLLSVEHVVRDYALPRRGLFAPPQSVRAVDDVSFVIRRGESVGLVGESGSGKSSLARAIVGLDRPQAGRVRMGAVEIGPAGGGTTAILRDMQMVFQDPYGSFNPRHRVDRLVAEPLHLLGRDRPGADERSRRVAAALEAVGISPRMADRYIHEFSGGQRQRIALARALIVEPELIVLDEAVSALDVSIRAQILDLLADISNTRGVALLFIAHDLHVVRAITDRVLVMKDGRIVEEGETGDVLSRPRHPYTQALVAATPTLARAAGGEAG
ncbi:ABC transporter ATP-binding protein [Pelagibacterium lacus]|uniref:ABC transporter ATP-binding protein n=1 Tax=Pelagibacterium lacus TaxID=2282655 RepID=A0A369W3M2_9HYPH|nr:ABC transporter ATP-binding protein [Pelagibacterium lacus]RDE09284.1 ABC transporter ATP-binding protein [Pelagibacterium lacus]